MSPSKNKPGKHWAFAGLALLGLSVAAQAAPEMIPEDVFLAAKNADTSAHDFTLPLRGGGSFHFADQRGKKVILSFWASWCTPCRKELPALSAFAAEHPELVVIAVNVDRDSKDAEKFLSSVEVKLPVAFDPDARALGPYGVTSMPTMFLFDSKGEVALRKVGYSEERGFTELNAALKDAK